MTSTEPLLRFSYEWEGGEGVTAPELAATWARLELWVGQECVTRVEEEDSGSARRSIYASLYPLAEWIAFNWWSLSAHVRPASFITSPSSIPTNWGSSWMKAHNLRAAGDGFAWPSLAILPEGESTRVAWHPDPSGIADAPIRYLMEGEARLSSQQAEHALAELVESVLSRLNEQGISDSPLEDEWAAILRTDGEEREFCVAAARLGLDPYGIDNSRASLIELVGTRLDNRLLPEFLDSVNMDEIEAGLDWIEQGVRLLERLEVTADRRFSELRAEIGRAVAKTPSPPWIVGWAQANRARDVSGVEPTDAFDFAGMIGVGNQLHDDRALQGVGGFTASGGPAIVLRRCSVRRDVRFAQGRALWRFAQDPAAARFLLTTSHATSQRTERAFAAELLAPAEGIRELLGQASGVVAAEDVNDIAERYEVSPFVIRHQVENQLMMHVNS